MSNAFGLQRKSIAVVLGTRPEIIKLAHIIRRLGDAAWIVHTGQHYDMGLSGSFFQEMSLPEPDLFLEVGGRPRGAQIGIAMQRLDELFAQQRPKAVLVQGDTNSALAGAVSANVRELLLCHVEAGLRSYDRRMPEEHNRVVADHLADLCCAPTEVNVANLRAEGIPDERIVRTGNTVVEAVQDLVPDAERRAEVCSRMGVEPGRFVLSTLHRPENVDDPDRYRAILAEMASFEYPVVLPLHPRSVKQAEEFGLGDLLSRLTVVEPIGYRDFLGLQLESALIVSDSGGVQEECSVLKRPLIVVRASTERPEVIGTFAQRVDPGEALGEIVRPLLADVSSTRKALARIPSPYGDGTASERTLEALARVIAGS